MDAQRDDLASAPFAEVLQRARAGDADARELLVVRTLPGVREMYLAKVGRHAERRGVEPEDVVQNTYLRALGRLETTHAATWGRFRAWLATIAGNLARDALRSPQPAAQFAGDSDPLLATTLDAASKLPSPSRVAMGRELYAAYLEALDTLGERDRTVISMRRDGELSFDEIAAELSLNGAAQARTVFSRALARLTEAMHGGADSSENPD